MKNIYVFPLIATTALAGCTGASSHIGKQDDTVEKSRAAMAQREGIRAGGAQISEGVFVAAQRERPTQAEKLPARLRAAGAVTLQSRTDLTVAEILARLTEITDLTHRAELGPDGEVVLSGREILEVSDLVTDSGATGSQQDEELTLRPNFRGSLPEVLDRVAAHFAMEWSYEDDRVVFRDYVSRTYQVSRFASPGSGSSSIGDVSSSYNFDVFGELETAIQDVAGSDAVLNVSPSTGIVNVKATLGRQTRIRELINDFNERMNIQIALDVAVVSVTRSADVSVGLGLAGEISRITGPDQVGRGYTTTPTFEGSAGNVQGGDVSVTITERDFSVSGAIDALSSFGSVAVETRTGATTLNNRPVPINQVQDISYAASTSLERVDDGDSDSDDVFRTIEPGTITVGYTLQMLPRIMNNRDVQIQYSVEISDATFREFSQGDGTTIELPEVARTEFEQQALLENGQTIVLAGFDRVRSRTTTGSGLLSASRGSNKEQTSTVIFITPRILERRSPVMAGSPRVDVVE